MKNWMSAQRMSARAASLLQDPRADRVLLLAVGLVVGVAIGRDFGPSVDEYLHDVYARQTIEAVLGHRHPADTITDLRYYGPAFNVLWFLTRGALARVVPGLHAVDAGHLIYYASFLAGLLFFHALASRIVGRGAALAGTLLFATQPAILGHSFINPKDIPFMAASLASVWAGLWAVERAGHPGGAPTGDGLVRELRSLAQRIRARWRGGSSRYRWVVGGLWLAVVVLTIDALWFHLLEQTVLTLVERAHAGEAPAVFQAVFDSAAQDAWKTPLEAYQRKALSAIRVIRFAAVVVGAALAGWLSVSGPLRRGEPQAAVRIGRWQALGMAGMMLGLTAAIRVFGLFPGVLVSLDGLAREGRKVIPALFVYWVTALLTMFAAWPFLWPAPFRNLIDAVGVMSRFPWQGRILYEGRLLAIAEIPWDYVPVSLAVQLTLPGLLLGAVGLVGVAGSLVSQRGKGEEGLILLWLVAPLVAVFALGVQIYEAFRQLLFVMPSVFLLAAVGLDWLFRRVGAAGWRVAVAAAALAPGLVGIVRLHPYEYVYHNEFVGGVGGAFRSYPLDVWCTAYREAIGYVNRAAEAGARVGVPGATHQVRPFAREDLALVPFRAERRDLRYAVICTRNNADLIYYPEAEVLFRVERDGAVLAVVKRIP